MNQSDVEHSCIRAFKDAQYDVCATLALDALVGRHSLTHLVMQLTLISFQRVDYIPGIETFGPIAIDITSRDIWRNQLIRLTLGMTSLPRVLIHADTPYRECQAHFYAGARFATERCRTNALVELDLCASLQERCDERELALAEIARLRPEPARRRR